MLQCTGRLREVCHIQWTYVNGAIVDLMQVSEKMLGELVAGILNKLKQGSTYSHTWRPYGSCNSRFVLDLIEKKLKERFHRMNIICPTVWWNKIKYYLSSMISLTTKALIVIRVGYHKDASKCLFVVAGTFPFGHTKEY